MKGNQKIRAGEPWLAKKQKETIRVMQEFVKIFFFFILAMA